MRENICTLPPSDTSGPPEVISVGLWRMGTVSMATAYNILGLRPHHAMDLHENYDEYKIWEQAAEATFPNVAAKNQTDKVPFTREQWDQIYGQYGAVTEIGAAFAEQLIAAYPDAKVVICRRDYDKWLPSFKEGVLGPLFSYQGTFLKYCVLPVLGNRSVEAMQKILRGFFQADDLAGIEKNTRRVYDEYFARIEEIVPPERRLEYKLGSGWEPLCAFLGKDVPDVEFPWANEAEALKKMQQEEIRKMQEQAWAKVASLKPW